MQKITPFLWFDGKAEEAANFYISLFENSRIKKMDYWGEGTPFPKDQVKTCVFELAGQEFYAFDAGPQFKFNEAISFFVSAKTQDEIDHFWNKLTADGGSESMCGWLKDKFGVSWQIVPPILMELMANKDKAKAGKAMQAMMKKKDHYCGPGKSSRRIMKAKKGIRKICSNGHVFYKSSDCPVCPICEKKRRPKNSFLSELAAPARRALENAGIESLNELSKKSEEEILALHGMGPSTIPKLKQALKQKGLNFKK